VSPVDEDPLGEQCPTCEAAAGDSCVYVNDLRAPARFGGQLVHRRGDPMDDVHIPRLGIVKTRRDARIAVAYWTQVQHADDIAAAEGVSRAEVHAAIRRHGQPARLDLSKDTG
jgi:hypothetical protein